MARWGLPDRVVLRLGGLATPLLIIWGLLDDPNAGLATRFMPPLALQHWLRALTASVAMSACAPGRYGGGVAVVLWP